MLADAHSHPPRLQGKTISQIQSYDTLPLGDRVEQALTPSTPEMVKDLVAAGVGLGVGVGVGVRRPTAVIGHALRRRGKE